MLAGVASVVGVVRRNRGRGDCRPCHLQRGDGRRAGREEGRIRVGGPLDRPSPPLAASLGNQVQATLESETLLLHCNSHGLSPEYAGIVGPCIELQFRCDGACRAGSSGPRIRHGKLLALEPGQAGQPRRTQGDGGNRWPRRSGGPPAPEQSGYQRSEAAGSAIRPERREHPTQLGAAGLLLQHRPGRREPSDPCRDVSTATPGAEDDLTPLRGGGAHLCFVQPPKGEREPLAACLPQKDTSAALDLCCGHGIAVVRDRGQQCPLSGSSQAHRTLPRPRRLDRCTVR